MTDIFERCGRMPDALRDEFIAVLERDIRPVLTGDVSRYARGRQRAWIGIEPPLDTELSHNQPFAWGHSSPELETLIETALAPFIRSPWRPETWLASVGGNITPHRDATYAEPLALGINLGGCLWQIADSRDSARPNRRIRMVGGEIFLFNCKHSHAVSEAAADRWALNGWRFASGPRAREWGIPERLAALRGF